MKFAIIFGALLFTLTPWAPGRAHAATIDSASLVGEDVVLQGDFPQEPCVQYGGWSVETLISNTDEEIRFRLPFFDPGSYRVSVGHVTPRPGGCRGYRRNGITFTVGAQGEQGVIGETGSEGPQGIRGFEGPEGSQGIQGLQGPIGPRGVAGKDAFVSMDDICLVVVDKSIRFTLCQ